MTGLSVYRAYVNFAIGLQPHPIPTTFTFASHYCTKPTSTMLRGVKKENLQANVVCRRPFAWRKKWEKVWDEVTTCSKSCNLKRRNASQQVRKRQQQKAKNGAADDCVGVASSCSSSGASSIDLVSTKSPLLSMDCLEHFLTTMASSEDTDNHVNETKNGKQNDASRVNTTTTSFTRKGPSTTITATMATKTTTYPSIPRRHVKQPKSTKRR